MTLAHVRNSFDLIVPAPYEKTAPLFGPSGERCWAGEHWDPQFLYPQPGQDIEGAVFTNRQGPHRSVWVNTRFDIKARHFQYVYFIAGVVVTTIDVTFQALDAGSTQATVVYTRTALDPAANSEVEAMGENDSKNGKQWESAIRNYLRGGK